ncbi:hypothetical protein Tsubulata_029729 [Turnera subulata]|uniref:Amidase domain-containing protein n=1 Tax=Turnera subulata TaxID=218843 RepID=A0A9Q0JKS3_9ROSI|nr:hypothetical protein Tsubulata_029729 [Turnera subulata]
MGLFKAEAEVYKPVEDVNLGPESDEFYRRANVKAPRLAGFVVKIFAWFLELPLIGTFLLYILKRDNLIYKLVSDAELEGSPVYVPMHPFDDLTEEKAMHIGSDLTPAQKVQQAIDCLPSHCGNIVDDKEPFFRRWTIMDYSRAYNSGVITPCMVAERLIAAIKESSSPTLDMAFFIDYNVEDILRQATESSLRYKRGEPISALDGVPIAIKDEIDCSPYPTTGGTKWLHKVRPCKDDACCVMRLRLCGAMLVGKTNMHELGAGTSGINPHYGASRNPYDVGKISGGSSSGSAAVVAAGLCPVALGVDGGGSVRMPAALCGVVGLKPTFSRVPHSGSVLLLSVSYFSCAVLFSFKYRRYLFSSFLINLDVLVSVLPLNWTVGMVGVLAATVEDAFITYAAISGQLQENETSSLPQPKVHFPLLNSGSTISNIKMARYGETVEVTIPDIESMRLAHYVTIGSECTASLSSYLEKLNIAEIGWDVRVALCVYSAFSSKDYIKAQKMRNRQIQIHKNIFSKADVIVTPTVGVTAYPIMDDALRTGELDYINGAALVRYQIAGNFLGLPAITVPVGYDRNGLPIGLQFIGRPWSEATLIHVAFAMQALGISEYRKPQVFYDLLKQ